MRTPDLHTAPARPAEAHGRHAGHTPQRFRDRFWVCLALTVPILALSQEVRGWLGLPPVGSPALVWSVPVLATGVRVRRLAIPLAAGVAYRLGFLLPPAVGALLMSLSTVAVATNAVLLRRVRLS